RDLDHPGERVDRLLDVRHLARRDLQRVGRIVRGEHASRAVEDEAAARHHRHHRDAVLLRERVVVLLLDHLQPDEARHQHAEGADDQEPGHQHAVAEDGELAARVAQRLPHHHGVASRRRRTACEWRIALAGAHASAVSTGETKYPKPGKSAPSRRFSSSITQLATTVRPSTCSVCSGRWKETMRTRSTCAPYTATT